MQRWNRARALTPLGSGHFMRRCRRQEERFERMKRIITILSMAGALAVAIPTLNGNAQPSSGEHQQQQNEQDYSSRSLEQQDEDRSSDAGRGFGESLRVVEVSDILNKRVVDHRGDKLGDVKDIALDFGNGRVAAVLIGRGGLLGIGEKLLAVPPSHLTMESPKNAEDLMMNLDQETMDNAPAFSWDNENHRNSIVTSYRHFGRDYNRAEISQRRSAQSDATGDAPPAAASPQRTDSLEPGQIDEEIRNNAPDDASAGRTAELERAMILIRATDVIGNPVQDGAGEEVGNLDDMLVDLNSGKIVAGIVGSGGLLGIGKTLYAFPPQQMILNTVDNEFRLRMTKGQLKTAPLYSADERSLEDPQWVHHLYQHYRQTWDPNGWQSVRDRDETQPQPIHERDARLPQSSRDHDEQAPNHERQNRHQEGLQQPDRR